MKIIKMKEVSHLNYRILDDFMLNLKKYQSII